MDIEIEQIKYEEPSVECCVEGIIDDNGVGFVDYFNFGRKRKSCSSSEFDKTTISPNGANFPQFAFLSHNVDKKMERKFEKIFP